jgi:pimeloyl-ACP methyl ester carboxylesterase
MKKILALSLIYFCAAFGAIARSGVIMIHELGGTPQTFEKQIDEFLKHKFLVRCPAIDGNSSLNSVLPLILAEYDSLVREGANPEQISVIGVSVGGYLGARLAMLRSVKMLILIAPAAYRTSDLSVPLNDLVSGPRYQALVNWRTKWPDVPLKRRQKGIIIAFTNDPIIPEAVIRAYGVPGMDRLNDKGVNHVPEPENLMMAMSAVLYMR